MTKSAPRIQPSIKILPRTIDAARLSRVTGGTTGPTVGPIHKIAPNGLITLGSG